MEPREFFIEARLESHRNHATCNLGESGFHAFTLGEILDLSGISFFEFSKLTLNDSPNSGREDLREEIASLYPGVLPEEVLITTGTSEALFLAFHLLVRKQTKVALYWPAFQALYEIPKMLGAEIIKVPTPIPLRSRDWENISADLYVLNHPHNPTGQDFPKAERESLLMVMKSKNKPVLFDEHYRFLNRDKILGWSGVSPKDLFYGTGSFTKCFGVTGLRIGWLIADQNFISRARSFKDYLTHTVSPLSECLALGLLRNRDLFVSKIQKQIDENIDYLTTHLCRLRDIVEFFPISGGMVGWAKLKDNILSEEYADILMNETGVFVLPGKNFEEEGFLRIGFGEKPEKFKAGIDKWIRHCPLI